MTYPNTSEQSPIVPPTILLTLRRRFRLTRGLPHRARANATRRCLLLHRRGAKAIPKVLLLRLDSASRLCCSLVLALDEFVDRLRRALDSRLDALSGLQCGVAGLCCQI